MRELHEECDYPSARLVNREELQAHVRSERYLGGLIDPRSGHLHPLKFTQGIARAAESAGAKIFENSQVLRYEDGPAVMVHTAEGSVRCAHLVLCGNAYIGGVAPALSRRILGVGTYIIATQPLGEERATRAVAEQCGNRRHQLDLGLFPALGRSPSVIRRPRELQRR